MTNTIQTNLMNTMPINSDDKKVLRKINCYILHTFLLAIMLLFIIAIIWHHYAKNRSKQKRTGASNIKMENN